MKRKEKNGWLLLHTYALFTWGFTDLTCRCLLIIIILIFFVVLLNICVYIQGITRDYSFQFLFFFSYFIRLPTINLLHCRSNEPCRHYQQWRRQRCWSTYVKWEGKRRRVSEWKCKRRKSSTFICDSGTSSIIRMNKCKKK